MYIFVYVNSVVVATYILSIFNLTMFLGGFLNNITVYYVNLSEGI